MDNAVAPLGLTYIVVSVRPAWTDGRTYTTAIRPSTLELIERRAGRTESLRPSSVDGRPARDLNFRAPKLDSDRNQRMPVL